jgi:hypothetical protein
MTHLFPGREDLTEKTGGKMNYFSNQLGLAIFFGGALFIVFYLLENFMG